MLDDVKTALQFLTRLPVRSPAASGMVDLNRAAWAFPVVGLVVGGLSCLAFLTATKIGLPPLIGVVLAVLAGMFTTGALHEDGLADTFDALGGHAGQGRALEIMRDSRIGTYGALALLLGTGLRVATLATLATPGLVATTIVAGACLSRAMMALMMAVQHPARPDGLGAGVGRVPATTAALACLLGGITLLPLGSLAAFVAALTVSGGMFWAVERWTRRRLGGFTGDTVGATQQICEIGVMLAIAGRWA